jgi:hypothetical protein
VIVKYLFADIFVAYMGFDKIAIKNIPLLHDFAFGLMPRQFISNGYLEDDLIIQDQDEEVSEMYFILEG